MSFRHRMAARLMDHASTVMPPGRSDWAKAMRAEFATLSDGNEALRWACGCVWACYVERINPMDVFRKSLIRAAAVWLVVVVVMVGGTVFALMDPHLKGIVARHWPEALVKLAVYYGGILVTLWGCELLIARFWASPEKTVQKSLVRAGALALWPLGFLVAQFVMFWTDPHFNHVSNGVIISHVARNGVVLRHFVSTAAFVLNALRRFAVLGLVVYTASFIPLWLCERLMSRFGRPKLPA